jgi:hypothetical protein
MSELSKRADESSVPKETKEMAGTFSDFLDPVKKKAMVAKILELHEQGKSHEFRVFRMVRKGKLMLTADVKNEWGTEENFDFDIQMESDITTMNLHLAKPDAKYIYENEGTGEDGSDYPLTILKEEADSFLYLIA